MLGPAATASVRGLVALSDLLRGKEGAGGLSESADGVRLDLLGGRKRPAGSAIALVLDGGGKDAGPINRGSSGGVLDGLKYFGCIGLQPDVRAKEAGLELLRGEVGELGDAVNSRATSLKFLLVALVSNLDVGDKVRESGHLLLHGLVGLAVLTLEGVKEILLVGSVIRVDAASGAGSGSASQEESSNSLIDHFRRASS